MKIRIAVFILLSVFLTLAVNGIDKGITLEVGKNQVIIPEDSDYFEIYASDITALNPDIEYIHYQDSFLNQSLGYVNVFGGIGDNFLVKSGESYEIGSKKRILLRLK